MARMNRFLNKGRRSARRQFTIEQEVRYQCVKGSRISAAGAGKTVAISSREVQFTTEHSMRPGEKVRLAVDWPALLNGKCLMKLVISGRVIRAETGDATIRIERHEFRTRGSPAMVFEPYAVP